jgi:hypothetical protein
MEWLFWLGLFTVAIIFQLHSVFTGNRWGMLTSSVRWLRARLVGRLILFPAWFWLTMHWFMQDLIPGGQLLWYTVAIMLGLCAAIVLDYEDYFDHQDT